MFPYNLLEMNKFLITIGVASVLAFSSCKSDYLETSPTDKVDTDVVFESVENANTALSGIYRFMFQRTDITTVNAQNKPGVGGIMLAMDFMGEDLGINNLTWFTSTGEGTWVGHRSDNNAITLYVYRTFYKIIGNANLILSRIDAVSGSEEEKNRIKSEALTLRAYAYSYLVQLYAKRYDATAKPNAQPGIPLVLAYKDTSKPRASVEAVYEAIIADLDAAMALNISKRTNKSQASVDVAKALRARIALTMQDYPNAIKYAKEFIEAGKFPLMNQEAYQKGFNDATVMPEVIWAMMPTADQGDTFGSWFAQIAYDANSSFQRANPKFINSALYATISATDVRKKMWEPKATAETFPLPTSSFARVNYMSRKFAVKAEGGTLGDVTLIRTSELYLILAEAYASSGEDALAKATLLELNKMRDDNAVLSSNAAADLLHEIIDNRRVELWGEGFRFLDLKRLNQALNRKAVPNYVSGSVNDWMEVPAGDDAWQYMIPRKEMEANPNIGSQNP